MAIRKSEVRKLRREFISRKARVWSRLTKSLRSSLNNIAHTWIKELISSTQEVSLPKKFNHELNKILREALAYGYWLNHIYLQEFRAIANKTKHQSKITLSDTISNEDEIRNALESLMSFGNVSEWHDVIPEEAVKWLDGYTPKLSGVFEQAVLEKTRDIIQQSMHEGSTLQERMKALREAAPELEAMSKARIESIARTEITRADSIGTLISNKSNDDVIGYEFSAIMDDRTTDICALRHGLFMKIDDPRLAENTPPCHCNCRSMLLPCTIYDFPDGLNTSYEFDEPKFPSAMQRPEDIHEIRKIIEDIKVNPVEISKMIEAEFVGTNFVTNGTKVSSLEDLREMASHGEMPQKIEGSREERARLFEEIDKLYERPLYVHDVKIQEYGSTIDIQYLDNYFSGIGGTARCPSGRKASSAEREGVIKHRMYFDRAEMELRIHDMFGGFPTPEMREKYYGRPITDAERASVMAEAERIILKVMGSPLSPAGREQINAGWGKNNVRVG